MTKRIARIVMIFSTLAIAAGYAAAFIPTGTPAWAPWLLAFGIPGSLAGVIVLGAARGNAGIGRLTVPLAFVIATLVIGFVLALALPANESSLSSLFLGLPLRAAIVVYGIGLMPAIVLPVAYALTFEEQILSSEDVERVRKIGRRRAANAGDAENSGSL